MKIIRPLVYIREYFKSIYLPLFSAISQTEIVCLTDFPTLGMQNIRNLFYIELKNVDLKLDPQFDVEDVVHRCRLLRHIDPMLARTMAIAMHRVMTKVVYESNCNVVVGQVVDDYITHVLSIVAESRGLKYVGICSSYFPGYTQISEFADGQPLKAREVREDEAQAVVNMIEGRNFRMDYANPKNYNFSYHCKMVMRYYLKQAVFYIIRHCRRDPLNYHYTVQRYLSQPKSIVNYPGSDSFHDDWRDRVKLTSRKIVYMPLAVFPEASTDYWIPNRRFIDYEATILSIVSELAKSHLVIIKEHAHMLGIRDISFYRKLNKINNVISVPPKIISNLLLEEIRPTVLVGAGSVGIEATLRGLPVVTFSPTSYWFKPSGATYVSADSNANICEVVSTAVPSGVKPVDFIRECLENMAHFDFMAAQSLRSSELSKITQFLSTE